MYNCLGLDTYPK